MQLYAILLIVVSFLTTLSGLSVFFGSTRKERPTTIWFFLATICASLWAITIARFLALTTENADLAPKYVAGIFISSVLMDVMLVGYTGWRLKFGKLATIASGILAAVFGWLVITKPELLYSGITIGAGNNIHFINSWFFWAYGGFILVMTTIFSIYLFANILKTRNKKSRNGLILFLSGLSLTGTLSLVFDLIVPIAAHNCSYLWVGPLAISITMLIFYYAIVRYELVTLTARWVKIMSNIIFIMLGIAFYMLMFHLVFTALFGTVSPSAAIILFNFVMIAIVLLLIPAINEIGASILSAINTRQINLAYVIKKLEKVNPKNTTLRELTAFLSSHLHFSYIGILANDKLYGSDVLAIDTTELEKITKMKATKKMVWQTREFGAEISLIAELRNSEGELFGKMIFGKPSNKMALTQKEIAQLVLVANLTASIIETEKYLKV